MASSTPSSGDGSPRGLSAFGFALLIFLAVALALFHRSFQSGQVLFSNDGPLGAQMAHFAAMPEGLTGFWQDLNWVGSAAGAAFPSLTYGLLWLLKPLGYAKFYGPLCILILGLSAWLCLRALELRPVVCLLGGLAAALNSEFFSYTCWGLGSHALAVACLFLALAVVFSRQLAPVWLRLSLAGLAVGMAVMEGFDSGAILSVYAAAAVLFQALGENEGEGGPRRWGRGVARVTVVAGVAVWIAAHALTVLIGTQVKGIVGLEQTAEAKAQRWDAATRWSLPRGEVLRSVIPGLHGYRMDTPDGGNYWGAVGRDPAWDAYLAARNPNSAEAPHPSGLRYSGAGFYAGVFVVLLGLYAVFQVLRGSASVFERDQRRWVMFWAGAALVSLLLALGRHAPFYQIVYALPYFSTIRNPIKFLHPFSLAMVMLCAYGLQAALVLAVERQRDAKGPWVWKTWWTLATGFERRFTLGCGVGVLTALLGWLVYAASQSNLVAHLQRVGFSDVALAKSIAACSVKEVGWFVFFAGLGVGWLTLARAGFFRGPRAVGLAAVLAGGILVADLARANLPWIVYYDYREQYASNAVIDLLRERSSEGRVSGLFFGSGQQSQQALEVLSQVYGLNWAQHLFPYYNIPSLDVVQEPRVTEENQRYRDAFMSPDQMTYLRRQVRKWELTSTRFFVGLAGIEGLINDQVDGARGRFGLVTGFQLYQEQGRGPILAETNGTGPFGLIEFTGALPKAGLYRQWEVLADGDATLGRLVDPAFDPSAKVLLGEDPWRQAPVSSAEGIPGRVAWEHYEPKVSRMVVEASAPSVLLVNDKYDPAWRVRLDGEPVQLLRANYLMRGVAVPAGRHTVEFRFQPAIKTLAVSLSAELFGLGLCGGLCVLGWRRRRAT